MRGNSEIAAKTLWLFFCQAALNVDTNCVGGFSAFVFLLLAFVHVSNVAGFASVNLFVRTILLLLYAAPFHGYRAAD